MKNISQENYLDQLLNSVDGKISGNRRETEILEDELIQVHNKQSGFTSSTAEDDFIREFERELAEEGYEQYISEFEMELDSERKKNEKQLREQQIIRENEELRKNKIDEVSKDIDSVIQKITGDDFAGGKLQEMPLPVESELNDDTYVNNLELEKPQESSVVKQEEPLDLSQLESVISNHEEEPLVLTEEGEVDLSGKSAKNLDDLLAEEEEFQDLNDLFSGNGAEISEAAGEIDAFGEQQMKAAEGMIAEDEPEEGKGKKKKKAKKSGKGEGGGFLQKLSKLFSSEAGDEDEKTVDLNDTNDMTAQELSEENQQILKELGSLDEDSDGDKKKDKKTKKAKEKKPKDKKAKEKKAKAPKPKKEPKPKKQKPVDNTPPLPKKPVILIFALVISMAAFVLIATELIGYANSFNPAKDLFAEGEYAQAFELVGGKTPRKEDEEMYNQLMVLSAVQSEYQSFELFFSMDMQVEALDSLVCAAGRYDVNYAGAEEYGCTEEMNAVKQKIEIALNVHYQTSFEEALEIYKDRNRKNYSQKIMEKLQALGLD